MVHTYVQLNHINGDLHRLVPTVHFQPFLAGATLRVKYSGEFWVISRTDVMPNWYVVSDHCDTDDAQVVCHTSSTLETLSSIFSVQPSQLNILS